MQCSHMHTQRPSRLLLLCLPALWLRPSASNLFCLPLPAMPACPPALPACLPTCLQERQGSSGTLTAIQWLIIGSLILTGICDLAAAYIVLAANKPTLTIWRWRWVAPLAPVGIGGRMGRQPA